MILYGISYSPWSLRAKWALKHHAIDFEYREYIPMVTTPWLRLKVHDFSSPLTVPVLIDEETILRDSLDIARYADARGRGATLFADPDEVIDAWTATADQLAEAGRAITTYRVLENPAATVENIPKFVPRAVRSFATPIVSVGAWYLGRKYEFGAADADEAHQQMRAALERIANGLVDRDTLGEQFGWADIAVAAALQFVQPAEKWARLGPASRECWTRHDLNTEFADVLQWRDRILQARP